MFSHHSNMILGHIVVIILGRGIKGPKLAILQFTIHLQSSYHPPLHKLSNYHLHYGLALDPELFH